MPYLNEHFKCTPAQSLYIPTHSFRYVTEILKVLKKDTFSGDLG